MGQCWLSAVVKSFLLLYYYKILLLILHMKHCDCFITTISSQVKVIFYRHANVKQGLLTVANSLYPIVRLDIFMLLSPTDRPRVSHRPTLLCFSNSYFIYCQHYFVWLKWQKSDYVIATYRERHRLDASIHKLDWQKSTLYLFSI